MAFFRQLLARINTVPGVRSASMESFPPLTGLGAATGVHVLSQPSLALSDLPVANVGVVGPDYFATMSIPLRVGRLFNAQELAEEKHVTIINQAFADKYLHGVNPLDRKSTRLNSSHGYISYAVFCLKKKNHRIIDLTQSTWWYTTPPLCAIDVTE